VRGIWRAVTVHPTDQRASNIRYLFLEVPPAAILGAAAAFNAAFAIRLGASNAAVGLLSSLPALLAVLVMIPSGEILGRRTKRMPLITSTLFLQRLAYFFIGLIPFIAGIPQGEAVIFLVIAAAPLTHFFGVGWNSMLADVIPEAQRARVFAVRSILAAGATTAGIFLFGIWLDRVPFSINYQLMYIVGFVASLLSTYLITKLRVPDSVLPPPKPKQEVQWRKMPAQARLALRDQHDFVRMMANTFLHGLGLWMVGPVYTLYFMRGLGATDGWIGMNGTLANLTPILGFYLWQRGINRWGENRVLKSTIILLGLYPLAVGLAPGLTAILLCTAINGLITPAVNLSHFSMLLKICPGDLRPQFLGYWSTVMNIGAFIMPLAGVYLSNRFGFAPVLVVGGLMCLAGSSTFVFRPLRTPDSLAAREAETRAA
jgi:MFS family permease